MSEESMLLDPSLRDRILANLEGFPRRDQAPGDLKRAAVAIVITNDKEGQACFLITRRASRLRQHAGQWALPGGRVDAGETNIEAALRETEEEVGLSLSPTQVLGLLDDYPTRSGFLITPVVIWGGPDQELKPNPDEVAAVYRVPLRVLDDPGVPTLSRIPESDRLVISIPISTLGEQVNAPTAALLYQLREVALRGLDTRVDQYDQPVFAWR